MENKNTLITVAITALLASVGTVAALKIISNESSTEAVDLSHITTVIEELKNELALETQARISLQQQVLDAKETVDSRLVTQPNNAPEAVVASQVQQANADTATQQERLRQFREQRRQELLASQQPGYRQQQLVSAGFAEEEAARIVQIESEETLRQLQAQFDRRRERAAANDNSFVNSNAIRSELGDQNYERYLEANGWPTSARVGAVIGGSAGEGAGLRAGDNIISYAGERVFNLNEINNLTIQGQVGESVLIEVDRNGESMQLTIPRGPIGINSGRRFGR